MNKNCVTKCKLFDQSLYFVNYSCVVSYLSKFGNGVVTKLYAWSCHNNEITTIERPYKNIDNRPIISINIKNTMYDIEQKCDKKYKLPDISLYFVN